MAKVGIFYGSSKGNTESVAKNIHSELGLDNADLINIKDATKEDLEKYDYLILGTSTYGHGDIQKDWMLRLNLFDEIDWTGKKVALFSLGDQVQYPDNFADGMAIIYDKLIDKGVKIVGNWYPNGYIFNKSKAIRHGSFVGLVLDEYVQPLITKPRIQKWTTLIRMEFKLN